MSSARDLFHKARNMPIAASVVARHLARGRGHAASIGARAVPRLARATDALAARQSTYVISAGESFAAGHLTRARDESARAGWRGRRLRGFIEGEIALLSPAGDARTTGALPGHDLGDRGDLGRGPVLHLVTNSLPHVVAGYTTRTQGIVAGQRQIGLDSHVVTRIGFPVTKGKLATQALEFVDGVPYHRLLTTLPVRNDRALAKDIDRTARLVAELRPRVLHAHSNHLNGQVALALRQQFGIPVVYEVRGFLEETRSSREGQSEAAEVHALTRAAETWCMEQADAVVTISEIMRAAILARGIEPGKVHVVPNGVGAPFVAAEPVFGPPGGPVTVGAVGTLNSYEGLDVLVDAIARVPGTRLLLVGDGPARAELEARAAAAGIDAEFTGRVAPDQVVAQHQRIDIYATPRRDLPVTRLVPPIKPVEAMALARPVVASDLPPLREIVGSDRGVLVPPEDASALAAAIRELAAAPDVRRTLGEAGRAEVIARRTWTGAAGTYSRLYASLIGSRPEVASSNACPDDSSSNDASPTA